MGVGVSRPVELGEHSGGGAGVVGRAEFVVAGLDDGRGLAVDVQGVARPLPVAGPGDRGVGGGDEPLAGLLGGVGGADDGVVRVAAGGGGEGPGGHGCSVAWLSGTRRGPHLLLWISAAPGWVCGFLGGAVVVAGRVGGESSRRLVSSSSPFGDATRCELNNAAAYVLHVAHPKIPDRTGTPG